VLLNVAVIAYAAVTGSVHVGLVPVHGVFEVQPPNALPAAGTAVNVTFVPYVNGAVHVLPQLMPVGLDVTVPVPLPLRVMAICGRLTWIGSSKPSPKVSIPLMPLMEIGMTAVEPGDASRAAATVTVAELALGLTVVGLNVTVRPLASPGRGASVNGPL